MEETQLKTLKELQNYYYHTLKKELLIIDKKREAIVKKLYVLMAVLTSVIFLALILSTVVRTYLILAGAIAFAGIGWFYYYGQVTGDYVKEFKRNIMRKIIDFVDSSLHYSSVDYIPLNVFRESKIFPRNPDRFKGDDYISGTLGQTSIEFSEIHAEYKTEKSNNIIGNNSSYLISLAFNVLLSLLSGQKKGAGDLLGNEEWHTIFKGLFFVGDFSKQFNCQVLVLPESGGGIFKGINSMLESWNKRGEVIKLEDPEFNKVFTVYSDDQVESRYILSTSLMARLTDFRKKAKKKIYISFVNTKIFIAIAYSRDIFEPKVFKTMADFAPIQEYFEDLQLALSIVKDLNLNTRIWSKQ